MAKNLLMSIGMKGKWLKANVPVTDIWNEPRFETSRINQVLFGDILLAVEKKRNYLFVYTEDNYSGWVNCDHVTTLEGGSDNISRASIINPLVKIYGSEKGKTRINTLSFGSTVCYKKNGFERIRLTDPRGWVESDDLMFKKPSGISALKIISVMKKFIGTPYLWGGRSGFGLDCSGLIQLVYGIYGINLPRDAKDQINCGKRVARKSIIRGDLIFSPGHVSIYTGTGKIIHSSLKAGGVKIESIDKSSKFYRGDIAENIIRIKRIL